MVSEEDVALLPCNYGNHILHVNTWDPCSEGGSAQGDGGQKAGGPFWKVAGLPPGSVVRALGSGTWAGAPTALCLGSRGFCGMMALPLTVAWDLMSYLSETLRSAWGIALSEPVSFALTPLSPFPHTACRPGLAAPGTPSPATRLGLRSQAYSQTSSCPSGVGSPGP